MTREELLQAIRDIGTLEDVAEIRTRLTPIVDEVSAVYDAHDNLTASNTKLEADKKKLQEYNMELYLQVGSKKDPKEDPKEETSEEDLKYEDLFNEKGEIK